MNVRSELVKSVGRIWR